MQDLTPIELSVADKVAFLSRRDAYPDGVSDVVRRETHMSWVFLAGDRAYKLKKPVRFPYLDFSKLAQREAACRAELRLNRRLARETYLDVAPLVATKSGLSIGGQGTIVDWLVVMRRLDERCMLDQMIASRRLARGHLDQVASALLQFFQKARPAIWSAPPHLSDWRQSLAFNRQVLLDPRFPLPAGLIRRLDCVLQRFLRERSHLLAQRVRQGHIVDGHGDLRPEHIWLGERVQIIDCLEFNARLRANDPLDEIAFLSLECARLGAAWAGEHLLRKMDRWRDRNADELFAFYRSHRAMLRARLAVAHLLEENPRTPEKWPRLARTYLNMAASDATRLERLLNKRTSRPAGGSRANDGWPRPAAERMRVS